MNLFDNMQASMFKTVTGVMGYSATWNPSQGGQAITKVVLYNGPTEKEKLFDTNYSPDKLNMEYFEGDFPGLAESVDSGNSETVTISLKFGDMQFDVRGVDKMFDGNQYKATLVKL